MTIRELLTRYHALPDAHILLCAVISRPRAWLVAHPAHVLSASQVTRFRYRAARRGNGVPLAYILGTKEFYGRKIAVSRTTLIPRPETELLVERTLCILTALSPTERADALITDIGTGSGAIPITLAKELSEKILSLPHIIATDVSSGALAVARKNARMHDTHALIRFVEASLLSPYLRHLVIKHAPMHLIITANLPYVPSPELAKKATQDTIGLRFEPHSALDGGKDGLDFYRTLIAQTVTLRAMLPHTAITSLYEIDPRQTQPLSREIQKTGIPVSAITTHRDLAGRVRVIEWSSAP